MDADSSYGGSDTAQDSHSSLDNSQSSHNNINKHDISIEDTVTTAVHVIPDTTNDNNQTPVNHYYHKNEITVPVNLDDTDFQKNTDSKPHYLATANLNINESLEHHNNLDEMSKNYRSQHNLQDSLSKKPKRPTPTGIDNPAFVEDVKSTFNTDMPYSNGLVPYATKTNNHEPVTEAVNLELINMKPGVPLHNGLKGFENSGLTTIPLKKDDEDMRSPYDEYFVPVNEHRKYMRGEKLYVTKDNRVEKTKGKCICWSICIALAVIAVILGILAAAGLLASQPPEPQEVESSGRSLDNDTPINTGSISLLNIGHKHPLTPEPPITTVGSIIPSTDESQIQVPRVVESELKINNLEFNTALLDRDSLEYKALSEAIEQQIKEVLSVNKELRNGTVDFDVKIIEMLPGSVVVKYRVTWKPKPEYSGTSLEETMTDPIDEVSLSRILTEYLQRHRDLLGEFHIPENSIKSQKVLDLCKIQNNGCEHFCVFDYTRLNFACLCPEGQHLSSNQKRCKVDTKSTTLEPNAKTEYDTGLVIDQEHSFESEPMFRYSTETTMTEFKTETTDEDGGYSMGDVKESTTKLPTSVFSAIPVEFPMEDAHPVSQEDKDKERQFYFNPILSGPPTEKPAETTPMTTTQMPVAAVNEHSDLNEIPFIPNLTVHPKEVYNKTDQIMQKMESVNTESPTSIYKMGNVYTPPAEVHFDVTTKKNSMYMIQILKPLVHKEVYREPKIQELHMLPVNSSETENNITDHYVDGSELNHDEYMSPFLPELENDTFVNSLDSEEEHLLEHNENVSTVKSQNMETTTTTTEQTNSEDEAIVSITDGIISVNNTEETTTMEVTTKAPSLELDQLNTTNPFDNNTSDATNLRTNEQFITKDLEIEPLKPEVMIIISDERDTTTETTVAVTEENVETTTIVYKMEAHAAFNDSKMFAEEEEMTKEVDAEPVEISTTDNSNVVTETINVTEENRSDDNTTAEIVNRIEEYTTTVKEFETLSENISEQTTMVEESPTTMAEESPTTIVGENSTTTESVAVTNEENTTMTVPPSVNETTTTMEVTTDPPTTMTDFPSETTEAVIIPDKVESQTNIKNFNDINSSTEDLIALETTTNTEGSTIPVGINKNEEFTKIDNEDDKENEISTITNQITTVVPDKDYQVKETFSDVTTTEKLFVTHKTTSTTMKVVEEEREDSTENLSIIPLVEENTKNIETVETSNEILTSAKNDEKPITEYFELPRAWRCSPGQFQCLNGTSVVDGNYCIKIEDRCDSVMDCTDGSDEINCMEEGCPNNFQCASKQCLKRHLVCDGISNCNDGSDEVDCESWICKSNEISCGPSNRCIPMSWRCDGRKHCPNGLDEQGCLNMGPCPAQSFRCTEESSCMPNSWKCDGQMDCPGGEDESSCLCTEEEFKCTTGGGCIAKLDRCDGVAQCLDKSDEWDCLKLDELDVDDKKILQLQMENNTWYPICMDWTLWNTTSADLVCQKLGYSASSSLESVPTTRNSTLQTNYVLSTIDHGQNIHFVENKMENCDQYVSISCQEYVCGSPTALDLPSARIVGGDKAAPTQWPSLALLYNKKQNRYCTSTLVTPIWAVTSYSCITGSTSQPINEQDWFLYVGGTNRGDNATSQVRKLTEIVAHPQAKFSDIGFENDAVLLKLRKPVHVNLNVSAICLPNNGIEPRQLCVVAGWGINQPGEPNLQQYLHYLPVPLIDTEECNSTKHYNGKLSSDKICAGYTDSDKTPCFNDEGAPLMCFSDKTATWELQGLLSHHGNCGSTNKHPAVYTAIDPKLRTWLKHIIGSQAIV